MDEWVRTKSRRGVNIWTDYDSICIIVENGDDNAQVTLTLEQAGKVYELLNDAIAEVSNRFAET